MIKAKPRKKNIVKVNEKQEIKITRQPTNEQLEESKLAFTLLNISLICKNHKDIWDKELRENDGIIPFSRYMEICKSRVLADRLFNENFETENEAENVETNFFYNNLLKKSIEKAITGCGEKPLITIDDKLQKLPNGFVGTLGSGARMVKDLFRLKKVVKTLNIEKEVNRLIDMSNKYFYWVHSEITFNDVL